MNNKFGKTLEYGDLKALGCTEEAIECKYNGSDSCFYLNEDTGVITEAIRGIELVTTYTDANEFVYYFNILSEDEL